MKLSELPPTRDELVDESPEGRDESLFFTGLVLGARAASGKRFVAITGADILKIVNLDNDTESPVVQRGGNTHVTLYHTVLSLLDASTLWKESNGWGPDPFRVPEQSDD